MPSNSAPQTPHVVFFVSHGSDGSASGHAMCLSCYNFVYPDSTTAEAKHYHSVMSDGTGAPLFARGLFCDCGEEVDFSSGSMVLTGPRC